MRTRFRKQLIRKWEEGIDETGEAIFTKLKKIEYLNLCKNIYLHVKLNFA